MRRSDVDTRNGMPALSKRFVDHRFPDAFGFEHQFNGFADRAVPCESFRCIVRGVFYLGDGIAHRDGQAGAPH